MIDVSSLVPSVIKRLKSMETGTFIDLRTFKRDRSVVIHKIADDSFRVVEAGFERNEFEGGLASVRKLMKTLVKREFPRSNKVRVYYGVTGSPADGCREL